MICCPSCKANSTSFIGELPSSDVFSGRILDQPLPSGSLYCCNKCKLNFRFPRLSKQAMDALYVEGESGHWQYELRHRVDWELAKNIINSTLEKGKILDVGCFDGQFLEALHGDYDKAGVEIHHEAAQKAVERGVRVIGKNYASLDEIQEKFDVVIATDVIEHTRDPLAFLKALSKITVAGGIVIIATGNTDARTWKLLGSRYAYCAVAEHISFINPRWCQWAARCLGLSVEINKTYCHSPVSFAKKVTGVGICLLYYVAPRFFSWLRRSGFSNVSTEQRPTMEAYPPSWHGAVDHFITVFRKK